MKKLLFIFIIFCTALAGCKKNTPALPPDKATLIFPNLNEVCNQGTPISATQSSVTFKWTAASNTDSYDLTYKNLLTGTSATQTVATNQATVTLLVNTPYSWSVTSKSKSSTTTIISDVWKFYNSGPGIVAYAPFPADPVSPTLLQNVTAVSGAITLSWAGSDVDNDIVSYDIYFDTKNTPALYKAAVTGMSLTGVSVKSGTTYYWKIITKDSKGNTSDSGVYQFNVN